MAPGSSLNLGSVEGIRIDSFCRGFGFEVFSAAVPEVDDGGAEATDDESDTYDASLRHAHREESYR